MRLRAIIAATVVALAAPSAAQARGLPPCDEAPCASDTGPILLLSYYRGGRNLQKVIYAVRKADLPTGVPVYYGDYWGSGAPHQHVPHAPHSHGHHLRRMESGRYAPIFTIRPSTFYAKRQLPADERRALGQPGRAGRLPPLGVILRHGWRYRYETGLELGRRFRDQIRIKRAAGRRVTTWQLDELPSELRGRAGGRVRGFMVGVLRGIAYGRPRLGDRWLPGIVFATPDALAVAARHASAGWRSFWRAVDAVSLYLVGEEYPRFVGRPAAAAARMDLMRRRLYRAQGARRSLARKYIAGMTPGYRLLSGLGGNVRGRSRSRVAHWRLSYVRARARKPIAGLSEYLLAYGNARAAVLDDVVDAMIRGLRIMVAGGR